MLLNEVVTWMRRQPGTTSLRALVYMDEIFGFFPPVAQPPSKKPMITLLKQARAFGVGLVLATQNPMDLDYKGLTNAGTWFIGRLQTDRDKKRILDGLEGVSSSAGRSLSRSELGKRISNLDKRVFLMHNVHEDAPVTFYTRWAMSYLRGPLTRAQIGELMTERSAESPKKVTSPFTTEVPQTAGYSSSPPALSPSVQQVYLRVTKDKSIARLELEAQLGRPLESADATLLYKPMLFAGGRVHYVNRRRNVEDLEEYALVNPVPDQLRSIRWDDAIQLSESRAARLFSSVPEEDASFDQLPDSIDEVSEISSVKKELKDHLYRTRTLQLLHSRALEEYSLPKESAREFRSRLRQLAREERDEEVQKITRRFETRLRRLQEKIRKAELFLEKKESTSEARNREFLVSVGESLVGMFLGRRSIRSASSSLSKYRMKSSAKLAVEEAEERIEGLQREVEALEEELKDQTAAITKRWDEAVEDLESVPINPRRNDVEVDTVAIAWEPYWLMAYSDASGARKSQAIPAFGR
jgi:hypothetical protein